MNKTKKLVGAFLLIGTVMLVASEPAVEPQEEVVVEEPETIVVSSCSTIVSSDYIDKYLVRLEKTVPSLVTINQDFSYNYLVTAKDKLKKVVVKDQIPEDANYVSSSPTAQIDEETNTITWTLYNLGKDKTVPLELVVNSSKVTDLSSSATIVAYPEAYTTTTVGVPELTVQATTILESVLLDSNLVWQITVANTGGYCAENVAITYNLPEGIIHASDEISPVIEIGSLAPGEIREVSIDTLAVKTGEQCSLAVVTSSNAETTEDKACITVLESGLEIMVKGPEMQFVGKKATYTIKLINTGDIPFKDVIVTDTVPPEGKLVTAKGAEIEGNTASWIASIEPGEEKSFELDLIVTQEGPFCNEANVSTMDSSLYRSSIACTEWRGYPALLIEVLDTQDPLIIGEETTYIIQIANQGTADDTNVKLEVQIPEGLSVMSAAGDTKGKISRNNIKFAPYPVLRAKEIIQYRVVAKAIDTGDLRFKAKMTSDLLKRPVPEEEATQVY